MSNNLNLSQVAAAQNQKEVTINDQAGEIDAAITEQFEADVSAGNVTLTAEQYRRAVWIKATGAATSGRTVTLQAIKRFVAIADFSTSDSVDFVLGSATITLAAATSATEPTAAVVYTDGTANGLYQISSGVGGGGGGSLYDSGLLLLGWSARVERAAVQMDCDAQYRPCSDMAGAVGHIGVNPTAQFDLDVTLEGASIGTISVATNGTFRSRPTGARPSRSRRVSAWRSWPRPRPKTRHRRGHRGDSGGYAGVEPMSDKHFASVVLLTGFEGSDGSTIFADESRPVTPSWPTVMPRSIRLSSSSARPPGLFDGNGDYISIPDSNDLSFGASDFTIETHVRFNIVQTSMFISKYNNSVTPLSGSSGTTAT